MTKDKHFTFKALTLGVFCVLILPNIGKEGLFIDGVTYGAIARNLAIGKGSFWLPHYTSTLYPTFIGPPPLALNIQSIFFTILGDYYWVERLHSLFLAVITASGIGLVWRMALPKFKDYFWLPLLLWLLIPSVSWCFSNNMLENYVAAFSIFGVYCIHKALEKEVVEFQWVFLSALLLFCSFLSKGIATLFPLAAFGCYALASFQVSKKIVLSQIWLILFWVLLFVGLTSVIPAAKYNLYETVFKQFNATQEVTTTGSRLFIIGRLFLDLLPIWILAGGVLIWKYVKEKKYFAANRETLKMSMFWLLIGLSGVLPIILSKKQSGYYIMPATMFFVLGLASAILPAILPILKKWSSQSWFAHFNTLSFSIIAFSCSFMVNDWKEYNRDEVLIEDIKKIGQTIETDMITVQQNSTLKWKLIAYFMRYEQMSLEETHQLDYYIGEENSEVPNDYQKLDVDLKKLVLFERITPIDVPNDD